MEARISFVTLGVADVAAARAFYERLGFRASSASEQSVAFFDLGGAVLALFGNAALAADAGVPPDGNGFRSIALAHNVESAADVDRVIEEAHAAGARIVKAGQETFWGGYAGYFSDLDGHLWEVAYNPYLPLDAGRRVTLPPPEDA